MIPEMIAFQARETMCDGFRMEIQELQYAMKAQTGILDDPPDVSRCLEERKPKRTPLTCAGRSRPKVSQAAFTKKVG